MALVQSGDLLGGARDRAAAAGDINAQRANVASNLIPHKFGGTVEAWQLQAAEFWCRIAVANGQAPEDVMRLVHILGMKERLICAGQLTSDLEANSAETLSLLAILADGPDASLATTAIGALQDMLAGPGATDAIVGRAKHALRLGQHDTPIFDVLAANARANPAAAVSDETARRNACFESLAAALSNEHGIDRAAAHLMITGVPDYSPDMLDTKEGWDAIRAAVAANLGEAPAVSTTAH